jgi:NAD dependent epimerase/dehydratase
MKLLVTGSEGFIGSHLLEELVIAGHQVTAFVQYNSFNSVGWIDSLPKNVQDAIEVTMGDVRDAGSVRAAVQGHEQVAHLAALIAIPYSYTAPHSYYETNALGTLNVLDACREFGVRRLVHTSTSEVYGSAQYVPIDEEHPLVGQSPYSASKIAADQLAHSYWASFGLPVTTLRPFNAYGPRQSQRAFIPSVMVQVLSGLTKLKLGSLTPTRDLTFVKDTAQGFVKALESELGLGEVFNMGSGFEVSMGDVVGMIAEVSGQALEITEDVERLRPEASEVERLWSDSSRMSSTFGWSPEHTNRDGLLRGLEKTYAWFSEHFDGPGYRSSAYVV